MLLVNDVARPQSDCACLTAKQIRTMWFAAAPLPARGKPRRQDRACAISSRPGRRVWHVGRGPSGALPRVLKLVTGLLYFDSRPCIFKLFFDFCCFVFVDPFLNRLRCGLDQILGFFEA